MQRARDMGFDTDTVYYHNSSAKFSEFKKGNSDGLSGDGIYFSEHPLAQFGSNQYEVFLKLENPITKDNQVDGMREINSSGIPVKMKKNVLELFPDHDGIKNRQEVVVRDSSQIRSINAAFGPEQSDSGNILFSRKGPTKAEEKQLLAQWSRADEFKKREYNKFHRSEQLQKVIDKLTDGKAPDMYGAIQKFLAILPSKLHDLQTKIQTDLGAMAEAKISDEVMGLYLYAKHAPERNAYLLETKEVVDGAGMSDADASKLLSELEEEYPEIKTHAATWRKLIDDSVSDRVKAGTISAEARDLWRDIYPNYVPLKNDIDNRTELNAGDGEISVVAMDGFMGSGKRFNLTGAEVKRAKGRVSMAGNILANAIFDIERGIVRGEKNKVNALLHAAIKAYPQKSLWEVNSDDKTGGNEIAYFIDGDKYNAQIHDAELYESLIGISGDEYTLWDSTITFIKKTITAWNPPFMVVNTFRDSGMAVLNGSQELGLVGAKDMAKYALSSAASSWRYEHGSEAKTEQGKEWDKWHKLYRMSGGKTGFMDFNNLQQTQKRIEREFLRFEKLALKNMLPKTGRALYESTFKHVEDLGSMTENMWRLAAFRVALEQGKSQSEAAKIAKNLTVNFDRKGTMARKRDRLFLFYNPAMQGLARMAQTIRSNGAGKEQAGMKSLFIGKAGLAAAGTMIAMGFMTGMQDDEDEYGNNIFDQLPGYEKMRSIPLVSSDGSRFDIPMAYGLGFFTHMGMVLAQMYRYETSNGRNGVAVQDGLISIAKSLAMHFNPFGGMQFAEGMMGEQDQTIQLITPVLLDPIVQVASNSNGFGSSLYPENPFEPNGTPDSEKVFNYKKGSAYDVLAKWLSSTTGGDGVQDGGIEVTPASIESIFRTFTGGSGRFIEKVVMFGFKDEEERADPKSWPILSSVIKKGSDKIYYDAYRKISDDVTKFKGDFKNYALGGGRNGDDSAKIAELRKDYRMKLIGMNDGIGRNITKINKSIKMQRKILDLASESKKEEIQMRIDELDDRKSQLRIMLVTKRGEAKASSQGK
jgi:hypothetical protein